MTTNYFYTNYFFNVL